MSKHYALDGLAANVELGKGGPRVKDGGGFVQHRNSADSAFVRTQGLDAVSDDDYITKRQLDNAIAGLDWKASVRAATSSPLTLATDFEDGDTVDGVTLATGDRIFIKDQSTGSENGIYVVNASGAPTRASDMAAGSSAANNAMFVEEGTVNGDSAYVVTNDVGSDVVGTDAIVAVSFASLAAGVGSITNIGGGVTLVVDGGTSPPDVKSRPSSGGTIDITDASGSTEANFDIASTFGVRHVTGSFLFSDAGSTVNIGASLPANAMVIRVGVNIGIPFNAAMTVDVGIASDPDLLMDQNLINEASADLYAHELQEIGAASQQVIVTCGASGASSGGASVVVEYVLTA